MSDKKAFSHRTMIDASTNTDIQSDGTIILMQSANRRLETRVSELEERQSAVTIVETILSTMQDLYEMESKRRCSANIAPLPLLDEYYTLDQTGCYAAVDSSFAQLIDSLWLGRLKKIKVVHLGSEHTLMLHPTQLHNDLPLPVLVDSTGKMEGVVARSAHRAHSFMLKNDPAFPGLVFEEQTVSKWIAMPGVFSTLTSAWPNHEGLERLASIWASRTARSPALSTLTVDTQLVRKLLEAMRDNARSSCHFTCTGETTLFAYICLTRADNEQTDLFRLPIGTIE